MRGTTAEAACVGVEKNATNVSLSGAGSGCTLLETVRLVERLGLLMVVVVGTLAYFSVRSMLSSTVTTSSGLKILFAAFWSLGGISFSRDGPGPPSTLLRFFDSNLGLELFLGVVTVMHGADSFLLLVRTIENLINEFFP